MDENNHHEVVVIGGGLSGLATAAQLRLQRPDLNLRVLEASGKLGGVIQTESAPPFTIDYGADMFASQPRSALDLCERLGVGDELIQPRIDGRGAMIVRAGKPIAIPDGFVLMRATKRWPMLTTPLLSPLAKLRFFLERWAKRGEDHQDLSVGEFVRQRMGQQVLDRIVSPLVGGIYTADIEKLSMKATMGPIYEMAEKHGSLAKASSERRKSGQDNNERLSAGARYNQFRAFRSGMGRLIESLNESLNQDTCHLNSRVANLRHSEHGNWEIETDDGILRTADQVVVATPAALAANLLADLAPTASAELASIEHSSAALVVLAVKKQDITRPVNTFGFVVPACEKRRVLAVSFASHKFDFRTPDDHTLIRVFVGGSLQPELLDQSDAKLVDMVRKELSELIGLQGTPTLDRVIRWNDSMPQYHVGHLERVKKIKNAIPTQNGLHLICNSIDGVGIAPRVKAAGEVSNRVLENLSQTS